MVHTERRRRRRYSPRRRRWRRPVHARISVLARSPLRHTMQLRHITRGEKRKHATRKRH